MNIALMVRTPRLLGAVGVAAFGTLSAVAQFNLPQTGIADFGAPGPQAIPVPVGYGGAIAGTALPQLSTENNWRAYYEPGNAYDRTASATDSSLWTVLQPADLAIAGGDAVIQFDFSTLSTIPIRTVNPVGLSNIGDPAPLGAWVNPAPGTREFELNSAYSRWVAPARGAVVPARPGDPFRLESDTVNLFGAQVPISALAGNYAYVLDFDISGGVAGEPVEFGRVFGAYATDNNSVVVVSNSAGSWQLGASTGAGNFQTMAAIESDGVAGFQLVYGKNRITVYARNNADIVDSTPDANPTGLLIHNLVVIPEPSTYALLIGLLGLALAVIRRRK